MSDTATIVTTSTKLKEPSLYNVVFHNDDFTPVEFVSATLIQIFDKTEQEATEITSFVHNNGRGIAGTYTLEVANQKKVEADSYRKMHEFPLKITVEEIG